MDDERSINNGSRTIRKTVLKQILAIVMFLASGTMMASEIDKRQVLPLNELQRDHILTEMRALLSGTQRILAALAQEDMTAVAGHARSLGMEMTKGEDHLLAVLPKGFVQLGMSVHRSFDRIAADAESLKDAKYTLQQLSESMKTCTVCHDGYQIRTTKQPAMDPVQSHPNHH